MVSAGQQNILQRIVATKKDEVAAAKLKCPLTEVQSRLADAPEPRGFLEALKSAPGIGLIAEVKKASPSAGLIRPDFDPVAIAKTYEKHGAHCLSVLTDEHYFQGHLSYLVEIRQSVSVPVLRKDFLIDPYQVDEARAAGADCVLLIAECLDHCELRELYFRSCELGMCCLIEVYDPENLERVLKLDPPLVGVNNRDLRTFITDLNHTARISAQVPSSTLLVSESGIRTHEDVLQVKSFGAKAILVGESLMRQPDIGAAVDSLMGNINRLRTSRD